MKIFTNFVMSAIVAFIVVMLLPGLDVYNRTAAIYIALAVGVINVSVKPLLQIFSIVPTLITIILALFFLNGAVVVLADWMMEDFASESTMYVILFSAIISIINWGIHKVIYKKPVSHKKNIKK